MRTWRILAFFDGRKAELGFPPCRWIGTLVAVENSLDGVTKFLEHLDNNNTCTDDDAYASALRTCGHDRSLPYLGRIHAHIIRNGRGGSVYLGNLLVQSYGKCGNLEHARATFDGMARRNSFSWNIMIAACAQNGHEIEALRLFQQMQAERLKPDKLTFIPLLSAAANLQNLAEGKRIHKSLIAFGLHPDVDLGNVLVTMYGKCGALTDARKVFDGILNPNVVSWNAMISGYARNGQGREAIALFRRMEGFESVRPNRITFLTALTACTSLASLEDGKKAHEWITASGLESDASVCCALINMYGNCGGPKEACAVFDRMRQRDVIAWSAMIGAYTKNGYEQGSLELFRRMDMEGVKPNRITFLGALAGITSVEVGKEIHWRINENGFESDVSVNNALIYMYGKCSKLKEAQSVFRRMRERDAISWNTIIAACVHNGDNNEAIEIFHQMDLEGVNPDKFTFLALLEACSSRRSIQTGRQIHERIVATHGFSTDVALMNSLINMYSKCGELVDARGVFDRMCEWDVISWTAMMKVYTQNGHPEKAFELFLRMESEGINPDRIAFLSILDTCSAMASLEYGKAVHKRIAASGLESDICVKNALVNMYGKCGSLTDAQKVFDLMCDGNVISWTAMVVAYARNGRTAEALRLFERMGLSEVKPDGIIFLSIFHACSNEGLLDEAWHCFSLMAAFHGIIPSLEHYVCMVDLVGRGGQLIEAEDVIGNMPVQPDAVTWLSLLGACGIYGDVERGARAAEQASKLDPNNASPYVMLSNIYATVGRWDEAAKIKRAMEEKGLGN